MTRFHRSNLLVLGGLVAASRLAHAQPEAPAAPSPSPSADADKLMDAGLASYRDGDYPTAIASFRAAYAADGRAAALFAMAQAERKRGDCAAAIADYDRFLATGPSARQADAAREQRVVCEQQVAAQEPAHAEPGPPAAIGSMAPMAAPLPAPIAPAPVEAPRWYRDPIADGALVGAAVGVGVGVAFTLGANNAARDANHAATYDDYRADVSRSSRDKTYAIVGFGGAAVLGGVAAWRILRHDDHERADAVSIAPGPGLGVALVGGF